MAGRTKMIIITSDEDVIRQFSLYQNNKKIQIIDLDDVQHTASDQNGDNIPTNLGRLVKLPESQSNNGQDTSKATITSKKSPDITCAVCGDRAIGFNYNLLSCGSCKAFFYRNAKKDKEKIKCITGRGECSIEYTVQRKCTKCRLKRCFTAGMRKEFLQTEEEKERRQKCLQENRNRASQRTSQSTSVRTQATSNVESLSPVLNDIDDLLMEIDRTSNDLLLLDENNDRNRIDDILFGSLSVEDLAIIQNLQSSFTTFFEIPKAQVSNALDLSNRLSTVISASNFMNQIAIRSVNFIRQTSEFEHLCLNDRIILTKFNLFPIFPLSRCYNYEHRHTLLYEFNEEEEIEHRFFEVLGASNSIGASLFNVVISFIQVTEQNPTLLALFLLILFFTPGLSMSEDEPTLTDPMAVHRAQSHYTKILWNYLVNQYGELEACRRFTQLPSLLLRTQLTARDFRKFFREQCTTLNTVDQITPLIQTVLNIS